MPSIKLLPPASEVETKAVLKKAAEAHRHLAELKGVAASIPNQNILIDTLSLREARESSAIENIISTYDEVFQSNPHTSSYITPEAKEVHAYSRALKKSFGMVQEQGLITNNIILEIQEEIEHNKAGFRKLPGTKLLNQLTGEIVYEPPQDYEIIVKLMSNLEAFINDDALSDADPLVKMAIIHHQFESIHPFYDGNGRTGRIINILYLIKNDLLSLPVLYLSRYIIRHKSDYYKLLQQVRKNENWEPWILFMLEAVIETAKSTVEVITIMRNIMQEFKQTIRNEAPKLYSQDLLNNLFRNPYTKIEYIMQDLQVSRNTAIRYLEQLEKMGLVEKKKIGRDNFFINQKLLRMLTNPA